MEVQTCALPICLPRARVRTPPVPAANHIPAKVYSSNSLACPTSVSAKQVSPNHTIFLRHSLLERQLFLRSRLELRRAVHSEDHVKEFLAHYTSTWTSMLGDWQSCLMQDEPVGRGCFACKMSLERGSAMLGIDDQSEQQTGNEPGRDPGFFESQRVQHSN